MNLFHAQRVYCIGIKGTGLCALAELLHSRGLEVSGSDCAAVFYTDAILQSLNIPYFESFAPEHIPAKTDLVIHSAAYCTETNPEMQEAQRRGIPLLKYPDALGEYSAAFESCGIAGVHGKTTTTALAGTILAAAALPVQVLAGSAVGSFGGRSTLNRGNTYFVAETCEYRRHFLSFHPAHIVLTSVESDHQDYFPTFESIRAAFVDYGRLLPVGGELIYCADDRGASEVARILSAENRGITFKPYGISAAGDFRITGCRAAAGKLIVDLAGFPVPFALPVPGRHTALNLAGALALADSLIKKEYGLWSEDQYSRVRQALGAFTGSKRRSEILGEKNKVLFMDDYAHHPTAIRTTLAGLKDFYPQRRLVVSFMSHTYTRTAALLDEFACAFADAEIVILHKIYASAREEYTGTLSDRMLFEKMQERGGAVYYVAEPVDAVPLVRSLLQEGDLFITLGAGDNWQLGKIVFENY
ncbi:MAG: UDP-N-acetylmuramate--L-alanine ligase [Spirochaetaceae bacterium]|jgi:UDP-N-acetylmuramate--alanine ligase|nr:UDP-N-acetylmuramate--L-alanine ligase [Spirochaetaceae bacterium]